MKIKALFLLTIFLLNSLMGFGCALSMDTESLVMKDSNPQPAVHDHNSHGS